MNKLKCLLKVANFSVFQPNNPVYTSVYYTPNGQIFISSFDTDQVFIFVDVGTFIMLAIEDTYQGRPKFSKLVGSC